jgi:hypothetical protein
VQPGSNTHLPCYSASPSISRKPPFSQKSGSLFFITPEKPNLARLSVVFSNTLFTQQALFPGETEDYSRALHLSTAWKNGNRGALIEVKNEREALHSRSGFLLLPVLRFLFPLVLPHLPLNHYFCFRN